MSADSYKGCAEMHIAFNLDKCNPQSLLLAYTYQLKGTKLTNLLHPTPPSRTDLWSFIGLVNQLSSSTDTIASLLSPLRPLLNTKNELLWSPSHDEAFSRVKASLTASPVSSFFCVGNATRLSTDASRQGLGFILQQKTGDKWTLILVSHLMLSLDMPSLS